MPRPTRSLAAAFRQSFHALRHARIAPLLLAAALVGGSATAMASPEPPEVVAFPRDGEVQLRGGATVRVGDRTGPWTLMSVLRGHDSEPQAVFEDFTDRAGHVLIVNPAGVVADLPKSYAPSFAATRGSYRGHALAQVLNSDHDLLGDELLAGTGDPAYADVEACLPPIARMNTYTFLATREGVDKVPFAYGGRSPNFDPAVFVPAIHELRQQKAVADGLVGGWLPVLRFVYPEPSGAWTEMLAYAPARFVNDNRWAQPIWYRVARVENGRLAWARYFDTYLPFPPRTAEQPSEPFYTELLDMKAGWEAALADGMRVVVPDKALADLARHSLVRAMMTRIGLQPKYGVLDRNYGGTEHDGFPDTFNTDTTAALEWGLLGMAGDYIDNYFGRFVRDDGSILYRGPETGQFGRMLTVVAQYVALGGDAQIVLRHRTRIDAIARMLLALRRQAQQLPPSHPAYGMIVGWSEADAVLDPNPEQYMQPYFGNSAEAARGFAELGALWQRLGQAAQNDELARWGRSLSDESVALDHDLQQAMQRSVLTHEQPACLPSIAGATEPFHLAVPRDRLHPLYRGYRSYMEMLFSGYLTRAQVDLVIRYRAAHRDSVLGLPTAYGYDTHELAGFLTYGTAYGLLQHDFVREFLLTLHSLRAHQYTRGTWTAPETRNVDPAIEATPYCVPAQLTVPMLTRWMLAWEDPRSETLWLAKATPRDWLADGQVVEAHAVPTRWGKVGFAITSRLNAGRIHATIDLPAHEFGATLKLRLRTPEGNRVNAVQVNGAAITDFDAVGGTISLPAGLKNRVEVEAMFASAGEVSPATK